MNITGTIKGIKYKTFLTEELKEFDIKEFDINSSPASALIVDKKDIVAISKWVSPKRTRSYPYERVYNTLNYSKKITVIPVVKDEGADGDRDYLQWDSVSLMSLLDVFVILAYYETAEKRGNKITNQKFNNKFVLDKIKEIKEYHSSALHWNLKELSENLSNVTNQVKQNYLKIEKSTGVKLHNIDGIDKFLNIILSNVKNFMEFSREKAKYAQNREALTTQPKEKLLTNSKNIITIENYLGGKYFFTVDETEISDNKIKLIECKYSKNSLIPSKGDIKDGLLKMILFSNFNEINVDGKKFQKEAVLKLNSSHLRGKILSKSSKIEISDFFKFNEIPINKIALINTIFKEANYNKFTILIGGIND